MKEKDEEDILIENNGKDDNIENKSEKNLNIEQINNNIEDNNNSDFNKSQDSLLSVESNDKLKKIFFLNQFEIL